MQKSVWHMRGTLGMADAVQGVNAACQCGDRQLLPLMCALAALQGPLPRNKVLQHFLCDARSNFPFL